MADDALVNPDAEGAPLGWRGLTWRERFTSSYALGGGYGLAALLTAVAVFMAGSAPVTGPVGPRIQAIMVLLGLNLILIVALATSIGWRVFRLIIAQRRDAGARLHLRFVLLFAGAAAVPAIAVALVFGVLVTQGVDSWFEQRVRTVVDNSVTVAKSWLSFQKNSIRDEVQVMAADLNRAAPGLQKSPVYFSRFLAEEAAIRNFPAAYLIDHDGRILARAEVEAPPRYLSPPPATLADADNGVMTIRAFDSADLMTGVARLKGFDDAYLYVVRSVDRGILGHLSETAIAAAAYKEIDANRTRIKATFEVSYLETVLLVLVGAVWFAMGAANSISAPIAQLVQAADRIAGGDLTARVSVDKGLEEIADLARSFNRMTGDLQAQRAALVAAGAEAESRSQFIETVLSGVSAGVIGLDRDGRISAENRQALALLGLARDSAHGRLLGEAAPELADVATEAMASGRDAETEVDVVRAGEARRLRVRASGRSDGLVLTFDDITRLVTAQRNAAWKDVARRIAHEIKNPLTPIQLSAERLRRKYRKEIQTDLETFDRCTETIIRQVGDIGRMVDEFSAFARMPAPAFTESDAAEMLHHAVFAQRVADPETEIAMNEPLPQVQLVCDTRMIGQALTNVLKNAGEAIAARRVTEPGMQGRIQARLSLVGDEVVFEVEDNGIGLPAKGRERLTEPYVTTREKGTGLGLAIVKRIIEEHGGELALVDAAALPGARAILRIPKLKSAHSPTPEDAAVA
jgi:two-component system, NtrC family, nitrogen regulation sensor histidine kinase NtrY